MATVEEIFADISAHMIKGIMIHDQMASYYEFLNLNGYAKCHQYHFWLENKNYLCLKHYYFKNHCKLIPERKIEDPKIISSSWYRYEKQEVDINTKRASVKSGMERWIEWETDTKKFFEQKYKELIDLGEVNDAIYVGKLIEDASCELSKAKKWYIQKKDIDFDINGIISEQKCKKDKYKEKIKGIEL